MIDLKPYVGRYCVVQFRGGSRWLVCRASDAHPDQATVMLIKEQGSTAPATPVQVPFVQGEVVAVMDGFGVAVEDTITNAIMHVAINPEEILSVTVVAKPPSSLLMR